MLAIIYQLDRKGTLNRPLVVFSAPTKKPRQNAVIVRAQAAVL
jgi:hypothetical protein